MNTPQDDNADHRTREHPSVAAEESARSARFGRRSACRAVAIAAIVAVCVAASKGCTEPETDNGAGTRPQKDRCYETLNSMLHNAAPNRLGFTTSIEHAVSRLNDWYRDCGKSVKVDVKLKPETKKLLEAIVSAKELKRINAPNFSKRDIRHIRNSLLMKQIAKFASALSDNDLGKTVDLFNYVVRNIELIERPPQSIPLPPFRILLMGRGTAEDRAWIFSGLLRQLRIPTAILRPKKMSTKRGRQESGPFLVGVLLDENVYLFDTRLGIPIPGPNAEKETSPLIRRPATLSEFLDNPAIQKRLNLPKHQYGIAPGDLKRPDVQLIGHRSLWSERIKKLNYSLVGKNKPLLFDELDADADGLIARISEFGKGRWTAGDVGIWPHPELSFRGFEQRTNEQKSELSVMQKPLEMPIRVVRDSEKKTVQIGRGKSEQRQARILQLMGKFRDAIKAYMSVRSDCILSPDDFGELPSSTQDALRTAMEDGWVWVATVKLEQQDQFTIRWLESQLGPYSNSTRINHARFILALAYRNEAKYNAAPRILDRIPDSHPQKHGFSLLARRWRQQKPKNPPAKTGAESEN